MRTTISSSASPAAASSASSFPAASADSAPTRPSPARRSAAPRRPWRCAAAPTPPAVAELVLGDQLLDPRPVLCRDVGEDQVLVGREAEVAVVHCGDRPQAGHQRIVFPVADAAVLDEQRQVPLAVGPLRPSRSGRRDARSGTAVRPPAASPGGCSNSPWNQSTPRSSMVYLSRACLRLLRSPKSRCSMSTCSATSSTCSGWQKPISRPRLDRWPARRGSCPCPRRRPR